MFPATAILFSRVVSAFELRDPEEMTNRGDFYSLMFFVLGLGSVVAYGTIGIFCNRIGQVRGTPSSPRAGSGEHFSPEVEHKSSSTL